MSGTRAQKLLNTVTRVQASFPSSFTACMPQAPYHCQCSLPAYGMCHACGCMIVDCLMLGHDQVSYVQCNAGALHCNDIPESRLLAWRRQCGCTLGAHWRGSASLEGYLLGSRTLHLQAAQCNVSNSTAWTIGILRLCPAICDLPPSTSHWDQDDLTQRGRRHSLRHILRQCMLATRFV